MSSFEDFMIPCLNKKLFGFECMGCGLQRSLALIARGELVSAFFMYPAIYALIALFLFIVLNIFFKFKHATKITNVLGITTVVIIIVSYLIKLIF